MQQAQNSIYQLKIVNTDTKSDVVYYQLQVLNTQTKVSWSFQERYKNMANLHNQLSSEIRQQLPQFPGKKFFGNTDPEFISTRKAGLQNYFKTLLQIVDVDSCQTLKKFLTQGDQKQIKDNNGSFKEETIKPINITENKQKEIQIQKEKYIQNEKQQQELKTKLLKTTEQIKNQFADLGNLFNPPEEGDAKKKRALYEKVNIESKAFQINIDLPKSNPAAKSLIAQPTIDSTQPNIKVFLDQLYLSVEAILGK